MATSLVILTVGLGSFADILKIEAVRESISRAGFPEYLLPFLGVMKLLGTTAIVVPAFSRFREAAYAGIIFYFIGASYVHFAIGDGLGGAAIPLFILAVTVVSYLYALKFEPGRQLGSV
ncbi:MAG: DoxX family protein [Bacteroidia bacterium]|nr:DoxX family protein [Bacteroidia bacterium]